MVTIYDSWFVYKDDIYIKRVFIAAGFLSSREASSFKISVERTTVWQLPSTPVLQFQPYI